MQSYMPHICISIIITLSIISLLSLLMAELSAFLSEIIPFPMTKLQNSPLHTLCTETIGVKDPQLENNRESRQQQKQRPLTGRCDRLIASVPPAPPCLRFIGHGWSVHRARAHTHANTNIETTAFVSRACGVIMCYITTSALRALVHYNGPDKNKCLAAAFVAIRRRSDKRKLAARLYIRVVEPVA